MFSGLLTFANLKAESGWRKDSGAQFSDFQLPIFSLENGGLPKASKVQMICTGDIATNEDSFFSSIDPNSSCW